MKKKSYKRATSRRKNRKKYRKTRRRKGGDHIKTTKEQHGVTTTTTIKTPDGEPIPKRNPYPEYLNNQMFLLNAHGNIKDAMWGRAWQGDVFGPPIDSLGNTRVLGTDVPQGTRITLYDLLHNGYAMWNDDWYTYIEVKGKNGNAPQRFYVSNGTTIERCKELIEGMSNESHKEYNEVSGLGDKTCSNPLEQPEFDPIDTFPPPPEMRFNPDASAAGMRFNSNGFFKYFPKPSG